MFEFIFDLITALIGFKVGAFLIRIFTLGTIKPTLSSTKQPLLISLLGTIFSVVSLIALIYFFINL